MPRLPKHDTPKYPIAPVLSALTGAEIPTEGIGWTKTHCPFHEDRTASAAINHTMQAFVCHSCGRSGDGIKLLRSELGLSFGEAKERAEYLTGITAETNSKPAKRRRLSDLFLGR